MKIENNQIHYPVLCNEVIKILSIKPNGVYLDATAGFGGHSQKILEKLTTGKLYCIDQDNDAIAYLKNKFKNKKNVMIIKTSFEKINELLPTIKFDGVIVDLGVSSYMFDNKDRGFSYRFDGPLDMRMDQDQMLDAKTIINRYDQKKLINIFVQNGECKKAFLVVKKILAARKKSNITTTKQLSDLICSCFSKKHLKHPAKQFFQALRIEVNDELNKIKKLITNVINMLKMKGKLLIITFHSLEDRIVKKAFISLTEKKDIYNSNIPLYKQSKPNYQLIFKKPIFPTNFEISQNYRSHSAKLRAIQKIG